MATTSSRSLASSLPCLVFEHGGKQPTTLYSVSDGAHHPCDVDELRNKRSWATSHGWVLVLDRATLATFLWNPKTGGKIALPSFAPPPPHAECALSGEPTDPGGCTVVLVADFFLWYCHTGGDSPAAAKWTKQEYDAGNLPLGFDGSVMKRSIGRLATCGGKFFYFRKGTELGVLEFSPEPVLSVVPLVKGVQLVPAGDCMAAADPYFLDFDGQLHMVCVFFLNTDFTPSPIDVGVYRMDLGKRKAVRVGSIGDRAVLAGSYNCFAGWCPAAEYGLLPNSVYWMSPHDECLHVFDIGEKTEEVREPAGKGVAEPSRDAFWMIPAHRSRSESG